MGAMQRRKGRAWEQECVRLLKPIFGDNIKRGLAQSRFGAQEDPDVKGVPHFWVESKHCIQVNLRAALEQAATALVLYHSPPNTNPETVTPGPHAHPDTWPVAFCKDNRKPPMAIMYLDDFLELTAQWWAGQQSNNKPATQTDTDQNASTGSAN